MLSRDTPLGAQSGGTEASFTLKDARGWSTKEEPIRLPKGSLFGWVITLVIPLHNALALFLETDSAGDRVSGASAPLPEVGLGWSSTRSPDPFLRASTAPN